MVVNFFLDSLETLRPYLIGGAVTALLLYGTYLYLDRDYKKRLFCAGCKEKLFPEHRNVFFTEEELKNLEFMRHLVKTGDVSDHIH